MTNHDTYYYGGEILNLINSTLESMPAMDRGGTYIWVAHGGDRIIYCNMRENDGRGSLEVYEGGRFRDQIDYNGILTWIVNQNFPEFKKRIECKTESCGIYYKIPESKNKYVSDPV